MIQNNTHKKKNCNKSVVGRMYISKDTLATVRKNVSVHPFVMTASVEVVSVRRPYLCL